MPSKRAGSFLKKSLSSQLSQTIFSPVVWSIEEFVKNISGLQSISTVDLLFRFYTVYCELTPYKKRETFETFMGWGPMLLDDINEIDRHLLNHSEIFNHLNAIQELNHWSNSSPTELISNYLSFWNKLPLYYNILLKKLLSNNEGYQGLIYRKATEEIDFYLESNKNKHHAFLGFNALNKAEETILQTVLTTGNSSIYWDAEEHFMNFKNHDASLFLQKYKTTWNYFKTHPFKNITNHYAKEKNITCTAVPHNIDQVKFVSEILKTYSQRDLNKTAIILGDESLIIPMLNSLPSNIDNVNITMGLPLSQTPTASFFENLFSLQVGVSSKGYYHKDLLSLLKEPLFKIAFKSSTVNALYDFITSNNAVYTSYQQIISIFEGLDDPVEIYHAAFKPWENSPEKAINSISTVIKYVLNKVSYKQDPLLIQYLLGFQRAFNSLQNLIASYNYISDLGVLVRLYSDIITKETIDLRGNPHEGLQIMGMLESRLLDFKNIILTSVNEGILPSGKTTSSFLPYDIKKHYGLPTYGDKDAVYTYHFYRLLHRANDINILYTTSSSGLGQAEKSRLILQLEVDAIHTIKHQNAASRILQKKPKEKIIVKTSSVQKKIKTFLTSGISPSAIGAYLRNPLNFYYQYILGVPRSETLEETIAANTMGTIIHNILEKLYTPFKHKEILQSDLLHMTKGFKNLVDREFDSSNINDFQTGRNRIIYEIICRFIENFLKSEIQDLKAGVLLSINSLENKLKTQLEHDSLPYPITFKGTVDRVDKYNGQLRIIDYKTGAVNAADLKIKTWQDLLSAEGKYEKAFQVLLYTYMLNKSNDLALPVNAGIISIKKIKNGFMPFMIEKDQAIKEETLQSFEAILLQLLQEITNPEIPFKDSGFTY